MEINENVKNVQASISQTLSQCGRSDSVKLVAVTKYVGEVEMEALYNSGVKSFGENRVEKFLKSKSILGKPDVEWHFIGALQSKKVKKVVNEIDFLHSLDRLSLAIEIEKYSSRVLNCFVQVKTSNEDSKSGISPSRVLEFIKELEGFKKIKVVGLMNITTNTSDMNKHIEEFRLLSLIRDEVQRLNLDYAPCRELSMGMSADYKIAIQNGATVVRVGSILY